MKFIKFQAIINLKKNENLIIRSQNDENHEIHEIPKQNNENHANLINPLKNNQNHNLCLN